MVQQTLELIALPMPKESHLKTAQRMLAAEEFPTHGADEQLNRFDRRREQTRIDLLEAAQRVISRKGYHLTRIADIASEADVGLGTFYLHFKTKNEIFIELVEKGAGELREMIREAKRGSANVEDRLRVTIQTLMDQAAEHPEGFKIVFGHSPAFLDLMVRVHQLFIDDLRDDLASSLGADAEAVANLTIGTLSQSITVLLQNPAALERLKQLTVNFTLGGLARTSRATA